MIKRNELNIIQLYVFVLIPFLIILNYIAYNNLKIKEIKNEKNEITLYEAKYMVNKVYNDLKNRDLYSKHRKEINQKLFKSVYYLIQKYPHSKYQISDLELTGIILTIGQTESSTSNGRPYESILFLKGNNFCGIKERNKNAPAITIYTYEYINEKKVKIKDRFKRFLTPSDCIIYLLELFETQRYYDLHYCKTPEEFFKKMKDLGYYTHPNWYETWSKYYKKYYQSLFD